MSNENRIRTEPATLWVGDAFSALEYVSLKSLVIQGMNPVLFCYDDVKNVPPGVTIKDANQIVGRDKIWVNKERNSLAPFSDYFRYLLLATTNYYWVDADVLALRPFDFVSDYFLAWHPPVLAVGVLSVPHNSPTLSDLIKACEKPNVNFPWLKRNKGRLEDLSEDSGAIAPEDLPYKALGPLALTWLMRKHGEERHALPAASHYPLQPKHILKPFHRVSPRINWEGAYSIHLFGSVQHRKFREMKTTLPPHGSFLEHMYKLFEVDPTAFDPDF
ncbi:hypothetical protein FGK63_07770 [Ruegeria sediminis]|uniref:Alpha 1,4-glycosyltransferase domain-containing protein n=1 Tax=Ruegeria sediminis TaxID=2583820 RepID=A0ABY2X1A3_9RHOB|nr:hypothetical protein [Ruegeria sediminis]TMV09009.1 hypothetical protein FGK63_07770 [Ruegeria sediminis]